MAITDNRHIQNVLDIGRGVTQSGGPAVDPSIASSWLRCLEYHQLDPALPMAPQILDSTALKERFDRMQRVIAISGAEMQNLRQQLPGAGRAILLTDSDGIILSCLSEEADQKAFQRAGLLAGADWSESREGTNGIGTCLIERQALTIHQDEHFRNRHIGLTCSASPVFDPYGKLLAVLDVSSVRREESRQSQFHTMAMVNLSAKMIESCYFLGQFEDSWLLRFHIQSDYLGLLNEGLLAFDGNGRILAFNPSAQNLLGSALDNLPIKSIESIFDCQLDQLLRLAQAQPSFNWQLRSVNGKPLYARLRAPAGKPTLSTSFSAKRPDTSTGYCFDDPPLQQAFKRACKVLECDVPILLQGETGSGKEAFAKAVHQESSRSKGAFVALNCAAIPETLIESELFGYSGGSFTGARKDGMRGKIQQAHGGTLFLDEIGDMPLQMQTRLLRVLEDRQVVPVGGEPVSVDIRIISASHCDLEQQVADGKFREDLFYRLNGLAFYLPALRDRSDKAQLIEHLLQIDAGKQRLHLEPALFQALMSYDWPGNVRQLRTVLRTLVALSEDGWLKHADLPLTIRDATRFQVKARTQITVLARSEKQALLDALDSQKWHISRTAASLGVSRNTLYRKLKKYEIPLQAKA